MSITKLAAAATAGNVDTDFLVPAGTQRRVLYGHVLLTTDATVADRRVKVQVLDDTAALVFDTHAGAVVPASQTAQHHEFMQGIYRETAFVGNAVQVPISEDMILIPGWTLRVTIETGKAGDSYTVAFVVDDGNEGASLYR